MAYRLMPAWFAVYELYGSRRLKGVAVSHGKGDMYVIFIDVAFFVFRFR